MSIYRTRRQRLLALLGDGDALAIIPTAAEKLRNGDAHYRFRPDSDFDYLTGFAEPDAVLVLAPGHPQGAVILFVRPRDPERELWDGRRAGVEGALALDGVDQAYAISELDALLPSLLENKTRLYYSVGRRPEWDMRITGWLNQARAKQRSGIHAPREIVDIDEIIHDMRLYKDATEIQQMQAAARITALAHQQAMRVCRPGLMEYQIEAELDHTFRRHGCASAAYTSIVAGGANACILHYIENNAALRDGDLLLIDAGAEYRGYAADVTRTFPVNGRFSPAQRQLYALVLAAQLAAIAEVVPGKPFIAYHDAAVRVLTQGLLDLGLLSGTLEDCMTQGSYRRFYMHRTGHWLGMDVHDVGQYKQQEQWRALAPGMVLTVEPGLYIGADAEDVDPQWRGIGIRIEDDVLVTETGPVVLTADAPKTIEAIESLMNTC